jgi:hypothetical protein
VGILQHAAHKVTPTTTIVIAILSIVAVVVLGAIIATPPRRTRRRITFIRTFSVVGIVKHAAPAVTPTTTIFIAIISIVAVVVLGTGINYEDVTPGAPARRRRITFIRTFSVVGIVKHAAPAVVITLSKRITVFAVIAVVVLRAFSITN